MSREEQDPIQEQLIQARRNQILRAAAAVFGEKGFHRATVRDVAKAAGVADGTIYNYFENKTSLLFAILDHLNETERREEDLSSLASEDARSFFQRYFRQRFAVFTQDGLKVFRVVLSEVLVNPELRELYLQKIITPTFSLAEKHFGRLVEAGRVRPLDTPLALRVITAAFLGLLLLRTIDDPLLQARWDELPSLLTTMFLDGLLPEQEG